MRPTNLAARAGRWSAQHRRIAILGWIAFVIAATVGGGMIGTNSLSDAEMGNGSSRAADMAIDRAGFRTVGGGVDLDKAERPLVVSVDGVRIGFVATDSIGETPAATNDSPGTNRINAPPRTGPFDERALDRVAATVRELDADVIIAVPHWGTQYTNVPERSQRRIARALVEAGADVVAGGHPHWVQGWEPMDEATVVHSLGNFVFDMDFMRETNEGIFLEIVSRGGRVVAVEPVPYVIDDRFTPRPARGARAAAIFERIRETSRPPFDALRP